MLVETECRECGGTVEVNKMDEHREVTCSDCHREQKRESLRDSFVPEHKRESEQEMSRPVALQFWEREFGFPVEDYNGNIILDMEFKHDYSGPYIKRAEVLLTDEECERCGHDTLLMNRSDNRVEWARTDHCVRCGHKEEVSTL